MVDRVLLTKARYAAALAAVALVFSILLVYVVFSFIYVELRALFVITTAFVTPVVALPICIYESNQHFNLQEARDRLVAQQREIAAARDAALHADRSKSQFLANMSHEIRTPMNGVIGMAQLLHDTPLDEKQREMVAVILTSGDGLVRIIDDILDFSRLEAGKLQMDAAPFDLRQTVGDVAALIGPTAKGKHLDFRVVCDVADAGLVVGDPGRLRQVLINLVGNAVKFTDAGEVVVRCETRRAGDKVEVDIRVRDTGCGIPSEKIGTVFEKFEQADGSIARRHGGAGLGLAISKGLVEAMGGRLSVKSEVGVGTEFVVQVSLPSAHPPAQDAGARRAITSLPALDILVAEDNEVNVFVISAMLRKMGLRADFAEDGFAAVSACERRRYDLVLMDISMPRLSGDEAVGLIRHREAAAGRRTPIVAVTAHAMADQLGRFRECGFDDVIAKPIKLEALAEIIVKWSAHRVSPADGAAALASR